MPHFLVQPAQIPGDGLQRIGMDIHAVALRNFKQPDHIDRVFGEVFRRRDCQTTRRYRESLDLTTPQPQTRQRKPSWPLLLCFQRRAENAGQVTNVLGDQKIVTHEPFDTPHARAIRIAHTARQFGLHIEGQAFFRAARQIVKMTSHGPQIGLRLVEPLHFTGGEDTLIDQRCDIVHLIEILRDPEQRLQVANAALAFFYVRLQNVSRIAHLLVAFIAFMQLCFNESTTGSFRNLFPEPLAQFQVKALLSPDIAGFEQSGPDRNIGLGLAYAFIQGPRRMPDLQAQVPQHIKNMLDDLFAAAGLFVGQDKQKIDIRFRRQFTATVAAKSNDTDLIAGGRIGGRVYTFGNDLKDCPN